jgi:ATP-dependent Zn protease
MRPRTHTSRPNPQGAPGPQGPLSTVPGTLTRPRAAATVALLVCTCALASATTVLAATTQPTNESIAVFEGQLDGHQVRTVTLHAKAHAFHASLTDGDRTIVAFSPSQQQRLVDEIRAKGVTVNVAKAQASSHKRRYIVGGLVVVVVVLAVVGVLALTRRRRMREEEGPQA